MGSPQIRRGLLFSFCEGLLSNGMLALNETFAVAAAVSLHASSLAISLIGSVSLGIGYLCLYLAPALANPKRGRKFYTVLGIRMQILLLFLCGFTGWLPERIAPFAFIGIFIVSAVCSHATGAFWLAWMGDLMPASVRGRHWAWRTAWFACANLCFSLTAGFIARKFNTGNAPWIFFFGVFTASSLLRLGGVEFLRRQYEPPAVKPLEVFSPLSFRPTRRFLAFSLSSGGFQGAAVMASPFLTVWFLRDLGFNYLWLSLATSSSVVGSIAMIRYWGRLADRIGPARVLGITTFLSIINPLPFLFVHSPIAICLANLWGGATWSGYGLSSFNHLLASTDNDQRHHFIAFNSLVVGVIASGFGLLGGFLASRLPPLFGWNLRSLFLLSGFIRFALWAAYFKKVPAYGFARPPESAR